MYYWVYVSTAIRKFSDEELLALLEQSRKDNERRGLTGVLLYKDGNFIQVIEGPEETVQEIVGKIERDTRHTGFLSLLKGNNQSRLFPDWSMGFVPAAKLSAEENASINDFLKAPENDLVDRTRSETHAALKLLRSFKKYMR